MTRAYGSFAEAVRAAAQDLGQSQKEFTAADVLGRMGSRIKSSADRNRARNTLAGMAASGELLRSGKMLALAQTGSPLETLWRALRARRAASLDELVQLTGSTRLVVKAQLRALVKSGHVEKRGEKHRVTRDQVEPPVPAARAKARVDLAAEAQELACRAARLARLLRDRKEGAR